jgi:hypothetical protein
MNRFMRKSLKLFAVALLCGTPWSAFARDVQYENSEIPVYVRPGEPTQILFPGDVAGGVKRSRSALSLEHKDTQLVIFASEAIAENGEAIIVRLRDGRSYSVRVNKAVGDAKRDDVVRIEDGRGAIIADASEEPGYKEKRFDYAPPTQVSGLMREMVLAAEFGKKSISGYRMSEQYRGETVLNDGTLEAKIDKIFIGPNLWGYVIDTTNLLDQSQRINAASFRLDGTRAVSAQHWELAARPMNIEQQISGKHTGKVYVVTRAKKGAN